LIVGPTPLIFTVVLHEGNRSVSRSSHPTEKSHGTRWIGGWIFYNRRKSHVPARIQTSDHPTCSLHTMRTRLSRLYTLLTGLIYLFIYYNFKLEQLSQYGNLLQCWRFGVQIPVEARFFAPFQTSLKAHPTSPTMGFLLSPRGKVVTVWCPHLVLRVNKELNYNSD